jgi:hypothetical protein
MSVNLFWTVFAALAVLALANRCRSKFKNQKIQAAVKTLSFVAGLGLLLIFVFGLYNGITVLADLDGH